LEAQIVKLQQQKSQMAKLNSSIMNQLTQTQNANKVLETTIVSLRCEMAALEEKLSQQPTQRQSQGKIDRLRLQKEKLTENLETLQSEFQELTVELGKSQAECQRLLNENKDLKLQHSELISERKSAQVRPNGLELELELRNMKENMVKGVEVSTRDMINVIDTLMKELESSYDEYETLAREYANRK
jgi:chromosome segregation ATPase